MYVYDFFFNDTATTEIYTLSLHDALPICSPVLVLGSVSRHQPRPRAAAAGPCTGSASSTPERGRAGPRSVARSEEHTSELQSRQYLVCRLLLEKKKKISTPPTRTLMWSQG